MSDETLFFPSIIGNDSLKKRFYRDVSENHLSHAYIIEGPRGSGRHTVALQVAAAVECERRGDGDGFNLFGEPSRTPLPCGECPSCRKILEGKSPDIITVGLVDDKITLGVDSIRSLKDDMYTAPNDLSVKVYIIEVADLMTEQAQNAFLLSLEEPPEYVLFFLLCESSMKLLETVRSRAPTLRTERVTADEVAEAVLEKDDRAVTLKTEAYEDFEAIITMSQGSIGRALELLDQKTRESEFEARNDAKKIAMLISGSRSREVFEALADLGKKRQDVNRRLALLQYAIRDLMLLKKSDVAPLCFFTDRDEALELSTRFTASGLLALYDSSVIARNDLDAGANVRLTLMNMMLRADLI